MFKHIKKNILITTLLLSVVATPLIANAQDNNGIILHPNQKKVLVYGSPITIEATPYIEKDTTMVPLRFICQDILQAQVQWEGANQIVTVSSDVTTVTLDLKNNFILANGTEYKMPMPAVEKKGYTYIPLRMLAELFNCQVDYSETTKNITVIPPNSISVVPIADFTLPETAIAGQPIAWQDYSSTASGHLLSYMWQINGYSAPSLEEVMGKAPKAGEYTVKMKVKNSYQIWSDWCERKITLAPNDKPIVTSLATNKTSVDMGEEVNISYQVYNEDWEKITDYHWTYSWLENGKTMSKAGLPRAFFTPGTTTVSLKLTDAYGNVSDIKSIKIEVSKNMKQSETNLKFNSPVPGETYYNPLGINFNELPTINPTNIQYGDTILLASNNPEKVYSAGILYQDSASGNVRIRYHHRNMMEQELKLAVFAENKTTNPITINITKKGQAGPSLDVLQTGTYVIESYLTSNADKPIIIQPGEKVLLNKNQIALKTDEIEAGLINLHCTGELLFTVISYRGDFVNTNYETMNYLHKELTHSRGTFPNADINLTYHIKGEEAEKVIIGRKDAFDGYFRSGVDGVTKEETVNNGNRGVLHSITFTADKKVGVLLNPRGTIFNGVLIGFDGKICHLANEGLLQGNKNAVVLGVLEAGETKTITYTPPSGSDSPFLFVFIPEADWNK